MKKVSRIAVETWERRGMASTKALKKIWPPKKIPGLIKKNIYIYILHERIKPKPKLTNPQLVLKKKSIWWFSPPKIII
jgi:hypothetical protein